MLERVEGGRNPSRWGEKKEPLTNLKTKKFGNSVEKNEASSEIKNRVLDKKYNILYYEKNNDNMEHNLERDKEKDDDDDNTYDSLIEDFYEETVKKLNTENREKIGHSKKEIPPKLKENTLKQKVIQRNNEILKKNRNKPLMPLLKKKTEKTTKSLKTPKKKTGPVKHKTEWNSCQNDLSKFKLTKKEIEEKKRSLQSKNLEKVRMENQEKLKHSREQGENETLTHSNSKDLAFTFQESKNSVIEKKGLVQTKGRSKLPITKKEKTRGNRIPNGKKQNISGKKDNRICMREKVVDMDVENLEENEENSDWSTDLLKKKLQKKRTALRNLNKIRYKQSNVYDDKDIEANENNISSLYDIDEISLNEINESDYTSFGNERSSMEITEKDLLNETDDFLIPLAKQKKNKENIGNNTKKNYSDLYSIHNNKKELMKESSCIFQEMNSTMESDLSQDDTNMEELQKELNKVKETFSIDMEFLEKITLVENYKIEKKIFETKKYIPIIGNEKDREGYLYVQNTLSNYSSNNSNSNDDCDSIFSANYSERINEMKICEEQEDGMMKLKMNQLQTFNSIKKMIQHFKETKEEQNSNIGILSNSIEGRDYTKFIENKNEKENLFEYDRDLASYSRISSNEILEKKQIYPLVDLLFEQEEESTLINIPKNNSMEERNYKSNNIIFNTNKREDCVSKDFFSDELSLSSLSNPMKQEKSIQGKLSGFTNCQSKKTDDMNVSFDFSFSMESNIPQAHCNDIPEESLLIQTFDSYDKSNIPTNIENNMESQVMHKHTESLNDLMTRVKNLNKDIEEAKESFPEEPMFFEEAVYCKEEKQEGDEVEMELGNIERSNETNKEESSANSQIKHNILKINKERISLREKNKDTKEVHTSGTNKMLHTTNRKIELSNHKKKGNNIINQSNVSNYISTDLNKKNYVYNKIKNTKKKSLETQENSIQDKKKTLPKKLDLQKKSILKNVKQDKPIKDERLISQKILNTSLNFDDTHNLSDDDKFIFDSYLNNENSEPSGNLSALINTQVKTFGQLFS